MNAQDTLLSVNLQVVEANGYLTAFMSHPQVLVGCRIPFAGSYCNFGGRVLGYKYSFPDGLPSSSLPLPVAFSRMGCFVLPPAGQLRALHVVLGGWLHMEGGISNMIFSGVCG